MLASCVRSFFPYPLMTTWIPVTLAAFTLLVVKSGLKVAPAAAATSTRSSGALIDAEVAAERKDEDPLSEREHEILRLLALGHTNQEIAKQLFISVRTAETHRAHIMQKLQLSTRAELVSYALANGFSSN